MPTNSYWLDTMNGRVMIGVDAVLIGRSPDCNIFLGAAEISRHHLLVRLGPAGAELLPLGRQPVRLNGVECRALTPLRGGDRIDVGQWSFGVGEAPFGGATPGSRTAWFLERRPSMLHLITAPIFRVGGGIDDDLIVESWEPSVLALDLHGGAPGLTALRPGVECGHTLKAGERVTIADGERVTWRAETLVVRSKTDAPGAETKGAEPSPFAVSVLLEFMPRGGQLTVEIGATVHTTLLSDRRCDLVACLLRPPAPFRAGEFIPEDVVCESVWPGEKNGQPELGTLLYRLRQLFASEGLDPALLLDRRGGGLRFSLAPRARVVVL